MQWLLELNFNSSPCFSLSVGSLSLDASPSSLIKSKERKIMIWREIWNSFSFREMSWRKEWWRERRHVSSCSSRITLKIKKNSEWCSFSPGISHDDALARCCQGIKKSSIDSWCHPLLLFLFIARNLLLNRQGFYMRGNQISGNDGSRDSLQLHIKIEFEECPLKSFQEKGVKNNQKANNMSNNSWQQTEIHLSLHPTSTWLVVTLCIFQVNNSTESSELMLTSLFIRADVILIEWTSDPFYLCHSKSGNSWDGVATLFLLLLLRWFKSVPATKIEREEEVIQGILEFLPTKINKTLLEKGTSLFSAVTSLKSDTDKGINILPSPLILLSRYLLLLSLSLSSVYRGMT